MATNYPYSGNYSGYGTYAGKTIPSGVFYRAEGTETAVATIKSGQVLKAHSFLKSDSAGKLVAHTGFNESNLATFAALTVGQSSIAGGITFTAGSAGATAAQVALAWATIADGDTAAAATTKIAAAGVTTVMGTFTAGTFAGWETEAGTTSNVVIFNSNAPSTNATDLAFTGTGTAPTLVKTDGSTSFPNIAGVLVYDVDASGGDVDAAIYKEASFWLEALVWSATTADTILKTDGVTAVACSAYNTGCEGTSANADRLKMKFVEGSEFANLGARRKAGELY